MAFNYLWNCHGGTPTNWNFPVSELQALRHPGAAELLSGAADVLRSRRFAVVAETANKNMQNLLTCQEDRDVGAVMGHMHVSPTARLDSQRFCTETLRQGCTCCNCRCASILSQVDGAFPPDAVAQATWVQDYSPMQRGVLSSRHQNHAFWMLYVRMSDWVACC